MWGALKLNRKVVFDGREQKLQEVASQIPFRDKKAVRVGKRLLLVFQQTDAPCDGEPPGSHRVCFGRVVLRPRRVKLW